MNEKYTVYMHISPSQKKYIGITKQDPKARWNNGNGYKGNRYFTYAIQKYGWNNFKHVVLLEVEMLQDAKKKEIELIAEHQSDNREYGYNITKGGDPCNKGLTIQERKRRQLIASDRWKKNNIERYLQTRRRYEQTEKRKDYKNRLNKTTARKQHRTEYMKQYRGDNRDKIRAINQKSYRKAHPVNLQKKKVYVYNKEMQLLRIYDSLKETAEALGYHKNSISSFLRGKKNCNKYIFKYEEVPSDNSD